MYTKHIESSTCCPLLLCR